MVRLIADLQGHIFLSKDIGLIFFLLLTYRLFSVVVITVLNICGGQEMRENTVLGII